MTVFNMLEIIKTRFPQKSETEIIKRISWAQREFAGDTWCLIKEIDVTPETSPFSDRYLLSDTEIQHIRNIRFLDSDGDTMSKMDTDLSAYVDGRYVYITNWYGEAITEYPSTLATIQFVVTYLPPEFTDITTELDVEERFHNGIMAKVLTDLYAEAEKFNAAVYYKAEYKDAVREGKKYANMDGSDLHHDTITGIL